MKVLITGATGYIGSAVSKRLLSVGHSVIALVRSQSVSKLPAGLEKFIGDLREPSSLTQAARKADAVIHTAFVHDFGNFSDAVEIDRKAIAALVDGLANTGKALIVTSGTGLLGDTGEQPVDETATASINSPFRSRALAEQDVLDSALRGVRSVVLRLAMYVYGKGGSVFAPFLIEDAHEAGLARYINTGEQKTSTVHIDDVAEMYNIALSKAPAGQLYNVSAQSGVTAKQISEAIAISLGCPSCSITLEQAQELWGHSLAYYFSINNQISAAKANRELGWTPSYPLSLQQEIEQGYSSQCQLGVTIK